MKSKSESMELLNITSKILNKIPDLKTKMFFELLSQSLTDQALDKLIASLQTERLDRYYEEVEKSKVRKTVF